MTPVVIVTLPPGAGEGMELAVHHREWGDVEVDMRECPGATWLPIAMAGGSFTVREA